MSAKWATAHSPTIALRAARVEPMNGSAVDEGVVIFRGSRIVALGAAQATLSEHHCDQVHDLGRSVILPGLINAHTHLELSTLTVPNLAGRAPALGDWLGAVVQQTGGADPQRWVRDGMLRGIEQSLRFGVAVVGDITRYPALSRGVLSQGRLTGISFGEVLAMASRRGLLEERIQAAIEPMETASQLSVGISPHAPYSIEIPGIARCLQAARDRQLPLMIHLAESADEAEFLAEQTGPLRELWNQIGGWTSDVPRYSGGPIRLAESLGLLDYFPTLLAHVNYCDDDELQILARGNASVVFCPRTHRYFGHPPHRWREMLAAGINVAVGTDSSASSPNLNPLDDLRLMHELHPDIDPLILFEMVTHRAATALGLDSRCGRLAPAMDANLAVFDFDGDDALRFILHSEALPRQVWVQGARVIGSADC